MTLVHTSGCIAAVKPPLLVCLLLASVSCTTLENRRDLYRSPGERYEQWHPHPPPTRLPAGASRQTTTTTTTVERHGVISFPEETLPEGR